MEEFGAGDCASLRGKLGACSVQDCEDIFRFADVGAVAVGDWVAVMGVI